MIDILNSDWLISMLENSSQSPQKRITSLFDTLDCWLDAPGLHEQLCQLENGINISTMPPSIKLQNFLSLEAAKLGVTQPEMLSMQIILMAISACAEKIKGKNQHSLKHAKQVAEALIRAQTTVEFHIKKSSVYAIAASFTVALLAGGLYLFKPMPASNKQVAMLATNQHLIPNQSLFTHRTTENPVQTAALFAQIEQMRKGNCQLIEAIQLPDAYKKIYFENIVLGQISSNPNDQKIVQDLLQKVRCNYTPMLMANSTD